MDEISRSGSVTSLFCISLWNKATERNVDRHGQIIEGSMGHTHYYVPRKDYTNNFGFCNLQCKRVDEKKFKSSIIIHSDFVATAVDTH
jgi:hypothetical protein